MHAIFSHRVTERELALRPQIAQGADLLTEDEEKEIAAESWGDVATNDHASEDDLDQAEDTV